jgi:hypothetical protein
MYRGPVAPLDATGDAARGRPDRFGLSHQAEADRRTRGAHCSYDAMGQGGWGEPEPGRRSLQQRGEPARSGGPRPDGLVHVSKLNREACDLASPIGAGDLPDPRVGVVGKGRQHVGHPRVRDLPERKDGGGANFLVPVRVTGKETFWR